MAWVLKNINHACSYIWSILSLMLSKIVYKRQNWSQCNKNTKLSLTIIRWPPYHKTRSLASTRWPLKKCIEWNYPFPPYGSNITLKFELRSSVKSYLWALHHPLSHLSISKILVSYPSALTRMSSVITLYIYVMIAKLP